jgi:hypothetical protein
LQSVVLAEIVLGAGGRQVVLLVEGLLDAAALELAVVGAVELPQDLFHILQRDWQSRPNKIISMSDPSPAELRNSHLEELFNRAKPRARYISESHVEEETTSIAKEIINGDIAVSRTKAKVLPPPPS